MDWYGNASCRRWYRRRTLASCFTHPSKMVYPPGEVYTPPESPEREILPAKPEDYEIPHRDYSYELDVIKNDSNYQLGPDTYLLQLRDVEFPCRLRSYMKVATARSPSFAMSLRENDYDYSVKGESASFESSRSHRYQPKRKGPFKPTQFVVWSDSERESRKRIKSFEHTERYSSTQHPTTLSVQDRQRRALSLDARDRALAEARAIHALSVDPEGGEYHRHHLQQGHRHQHHELTTTTYGVQRMRPQVQPLPELPCPTCGNPDYQPE